MCPESWIPLLEPTPGFSERLSFTIAGDASNPFVAWYAARLQETLARQGHIHRPSSPASDLDAVAEHADTAAQPPIRLVLNLCDLDRPRPVHRRGQGTFVATIVDGADNEREIMKAAYPVLVRSLSNMVIYNTRVNGVLESHFITIEQGHYVVRHTGSEQDFFERIFERIQPLACSHLVINNEFSADLPGELQQGDEQTRQISWAGQQLDSTGAAAGRLPDPRSAV